MKHYDAIVVGLGAMGSAALYHLARRGARVAGFDTYTPPHALGSSHGETRMIREAYYEDTRYVPLLQRAYDLWHEAAREAGNELIVETGAVYAGPPKAELIAGILRAGNDHNIPITELSGSILSARAPWLRVPDDMVAVGEARGGYLHPERCIESHLRLAAGLGAEVHTGEAVLGWEVKGSSVVCETKNEHFAAARLVLSSGAGITDWLGAVDVRTTVTRQPMFWFQPGPNAASLRTVFAIQIDEQRLLYGFPDLGGGVKTSIHYGGEATTWATINRTIDFAESKETAELCARFLPGVHGKVMRAVVCMYTNTADFHFLIDAHPEHDNVLFVSACSGHGFKFASAIGEAASQWALDGKPKLDLSLFSLDRLRSRK